MLSGEGRSKKGKGGKVRDVEGTGVCEGGGGGAFGADLRGRQVRERERERREPRAVASKALMRQRLWHDKRVYRAMHGGAAALACVAFPGCAAALFCCTAV